LSVTVFDPWSTRDHPGRDDIVVAEALTPA
jgi:hypothetical protein